MEKKQAEHRRARTAGFTLVELMVVVAIIAILATTAGVYLFGALDDADQTKAKAEIQAMKSAITAYMLKNNRKLPNTLDEIAPFMDPPRVPKDPWGNAYVYTKEGTRSFKIVSYGADGAPGGDEVNADVTSE
jgi:general secretion pathway protein G